MKKYKSFITIVSLILGIVFGIFLPEFMKEISFLGTIYINLLKFIMIPIILTSIIVAIYNSKRINTKLLLKTVLIFITMFIITFLITSIITFIFKPGNGYNFNVIEWNSEPVKPQVSDIVVNLFSSNIIDMIQKNSIFSTILFAIFFGIAANRVKNGEKAIEITEALRDILYKLLEFIMYLTPIGVFSLIGSTVANYGNVILDMGLKYILFAYLCSVIALIFVMILPVWVIAKINPITYIKKSAKVWLMTITTCSSAATLPLTIKTCNEDFNVPSKITDIVVPLGCTIHMCGGAVSFALLGIFCTQLFGVVITPLVFMQMLFIALIINMAAPGIPSGGIVIGASYLSMIGIPLDFIGFYSGIYKLLDMSYTTLNVTGDISANILVNHSKNSSKI